MAHTKGCKNLNESYSKISFRYLRDTAGKYMFKVNNRNTRTRCEISSWCRFGVFIVDVKDISHIVLVFLLFPLFLLIPPENIRKPELF